MRQNITQQRLKTPCLCGQKQQNLQGNGFIFKTSKMASIVPQKFRNQHFLKKGVPFCFGFFLCFGFFIEKPYYLC